MRPGTQFIYEGEAFEEDGEPVRRRVIFTVTDLTKVVDGIRTVVVWDRDYDDEELVEGEIAFYAQDNNGAVWLFGEYPEEYEGSQFVGAPAWVSGAQGAKAGVMMQPQPTVGTPAYQQGLGPEVEFADRARVEKTGQRTCVPVKCYSNVLVTREWDRNEPGVYQFKYYAPHVGNVRVGFGGNDPERETLELVELIQLDSHGLADAREEARRLDRRAFRISEAYGGTAPVEGPPEV